MLSKSQAIQELLMSQVTLQVILLTKLGFVNYLKKYILLPVQQIDYLVL